MIVLHPQRPSSQTRNTRDTFFFENLVVLVHNPPELAGCWEVLGGVGRRWEVLGGVGRCWGVLGGVGGCWRALGGEALFFPPA